MVYLATLIRKVCYHEGVKHSWKTSMLSRTLTYEFFPSLAIQRDVNQANALSRPWR